MFLLFYYLKKKKTNIPQCSSFPKGMGRVIVHSLRLAYAKRLFSDLSP